MEMFFANILELMTTTVYLSVGLRKARGLTQPELATRAGVSKSYVWKIERSGASQAVNVRPSADTLNKLANALAVSVSELVADVPAGESVTHSILRLTHRRTPDALKAFVKECRRKKEALSEPEVFMLSMIQYNGKRPKTVEDWRFVYEAIKRSVGT